MGKEWRSRQHMNELVCVFVRWCYSGPLGCGTGNQGGAMSEATKDGTAGRGGWTRREFLAAAGGHAQQRRDLQLAAAPAAGQPPGGQPGGGSPPSPFGLLGTAGWGGAR